MASAIEKINKVVEFIKNIATTIAFFYIAYFVVNSPGFDIFKIGRNAASKIVEEYLDAKKTLDTANKQALKPIDKTVPSNLVSVAEFVDSVDKDNMTWVYIGQMLNGKLINNHFNVSVLSKEGDIITAKDAVYKRKDYPIELKTDDWRLGEIKGVVKTGAPVKIVTIKQIADSNYWALVK
jgi:hypothetical protein